MPDDKDKLAQGGDVLKALRVAAKGLLYPSESDKPLKAFLWKGTPPDGDASEAALRVQIEAPDSAVVQSLPLERFFGPVTTEQDWFGEEERERAQRFRALQEALGRHLAGLRAFRVEGGHADDRSVVDVYVVGQTAGGGLAGVSTQVVET